MFYTTALYAALGLFLIGLIVKVSRWFRLNPGGIAGTSPTQRLAAFAKAAFTTIFSRKILQLIRTLILDVLLQLKILRESRLRWVSHMLICWGFIFLLLMHALDYFTVSRMVSPYYPTLNPFLFLRNLFGAFVLVGLMLVVYRRFFMKQGPLLTNAMDKYLLVLLAVIFFSGIALETLRLTSRTEFELMVTDYAGLDLEYDEQEITHLESYWVETFGLVSARVHRPFDAAILEQGRATHEMFCADCHSSYRWAFLSYGASKMIGRTVALQLDRQPVMSFFWYLHVFSCLIGLAYLPFSKMFHVITSPISLLANGVTEAGKSHPLNVATRQAMELDACTHCGACSLRCSVGITFDLLSNVYVLPSEKIAAVKAMIGSKSLSEKDLATIANGFYFCVNCNRCTEVCPAGINLQDLWFDVREELLQRDTPIYYMLSNLSFYRGLKRDALTREAYQKPIIRLQADVADEFQRANRNGGSTDLSQIDPAMKNRLALSLQGNSFSSCFTCTTCSLVCPVVANFPDSKEALGLLPHQVVHAANLGMLHLAFASKMLWSCLGCYECQEYCPQGVRVADVFYELKNIAIDCFNQKTESR